MKTLDIWACDNGCGNEVEEYLLTQMASPDDTKLMLVCPVCKEYKGLMPINEAEEYLQDDE